MAKGKDTTLAVDLRAGGRYMYLKGTLDVDVQVRGTGRIGPFQLPPIVGGLSRDMGGSRDWLEPLVGTVLTLDVNDRLSLIARGDIGGFGVGSKLTWQVAGAVEYKIGKCVSVSAGYRLLDIDFSEGSGRNKFAFDVQMRGPFMALDIRF